MTNIFENKEIPSVSDDKAYTLKLVKLFENRRFAFEMAANLVMTLTAISDIDKSEYKKLPSKIAQNLKVYLEHDSGTLRRVLNLFNLPESTDEDELIKRLTYLLLQLLDRGLLINGLNIKFTDVISAPLTNMNITIKASKFGITQYTDAFILDVHEKFTGNFEDTQSQEGAAEALQKLVDMISRMYG